MRRSLIFSAIAAIGLGATGPAPGGPQPLRPVPFTQVKLDDDFWLPRMRTCIDKTIPHCLRMCEETGRIRNWDRAARALGGEAAAADYEGYFFNDSDVYKVMEAAAYAIAIDPTATYGGRRLSDHLDELIAKVAAMQWPDGYVNSYFTLKKATEPRWTDIEHKHELYCAGHLIEAAVAHQRVTGQRRFLDVALRLADHLVDTFGPSQRQNPNPCGHPEIELALLALAKRMASLESERGGPTNDARALAESMKLTDLHTRDRPRTDRTFRYATLASFFLEQRGSRQWGRQRLWGEYAQDDILLRERREVAGHAVRAMYLFTAAADMAIHVPQFALGYEAALDAAWTDLTQRRMYVTGGIGTSRHNEGFTEPYELPNDTAYAETCAAIGLVFWAQRMNLLRADARYFDVLERALYNGVRAGVSLDGQQFHYTNPLASRGQHRRQPWFPCACCPPNIARLLPTIGGYQYAVAEDALYVNLYAAGTADASIPRAAGSADAAVAVRIRQQTRYPWDGVVTLSVAVDTPAEFALHLRVPGWCSRPKLTGESDALPAPTLSKGYMTIRGAWRGTTELRLELPMPIERVRSDPRIQANAGRVALRRGPIVYCCEAVDNGGRVRDAFLAPDAPLRDEFRSELLGGVTVIRGPLTHRHARRTPGGAEEVAELTRDGVWIPYATWNNRDAGEMIIWMPDAPAGVEAPPRSGVRASASRCGTHDALEALYDRVEPADSSDRTIPRFTWWPAKGSSEWVRYEFDSPLRVSSVAVYWFDDSKAGGGCGPPASWNLQYRDGDEWRDVAVREPGAARPKYGTAVNEFNRVAFDPVTTTGLRITVQLAEARSGGILEWTIETE